MNHMGTYPPHQQEYIRLVRGVVDLPPENEAEAIYVGQSFVDAIKGNGGSITDDFIRDHAQRDLKTFSDMFDIRSVAAMYLAATLSLRPEYERTFQSWVDPSMGEVFQRLQRFRDESLEQEKNKPMYAQDVRQGIEELERWVNNR